MAVDKKKISKDRIVNTLLVKVEENQSIKDVNLRGIAKAMGCAHTNIYNYFNNFSEIIWTALGQILSNMIDDVEARVALGKNDQERFFIALDTIISFSLDHPGWYRLVWLESIDGEPPEEIAMILTKPTAGFEELLSKASGEHLTDIDVSRIANMLHSYMHGEICQWLSGRAKEKQKKELRAEILSNLKQMYQLLTQEIE
ncbi:TetR/AcrR family transcriptional regulator [Amphibacillus cookii]|uniref:TetR/AcrR family transcriptional regulator n=1 Tax=Amphibacillus cookii TaxID=767787 RepID=UPI00195CD961|nr:TetR/AcrR family transcriptional regulator [Amphibacillus cookii]MBM7540751.1 AcrR family transcriptional regulator [Amphibacillus cookii]